MYSVKIIISFCFVIIQINMFAVIRYVKPAGTGIQSGLSWTDASASLQDMINASSSGDQVWVAAGTYNPTKNLAGMVSTADPRKRAFLLKNGVKVYGGFFGNETAVSQQNHKLYKTILSGDLNNNDSIVGIGANMQVFNIGDNTYHVVVSAKDTVVGDILNGFYIMGGNADMNVAGDIVDGVSTSRNTGGGLYIVKSQVSIMNCIIIHNFSRLVGAGIYSYLNTIVFNNCEINGNAIIGNGTMRGAGIYSNSEDINFLNCNFLNNTLIGSSNDMSGAAIFSWYSPSTTISKCIFLNNKSQDTTYQTFKYGAVSIINGTTSISSIDQCAFSNNGNSGSSGGALEIRNGGVSATISNSVFEKNTGYEGGAVRTGVPNSKILNCTFYNNYASSNGRALVGSSNINAKNCIFWNNTGNGTVIYTSSILITNSIVQGTPLYAGAGNSNSSPLFTNALSPIGADGIWRTSDDGLQLDCNSPAYNVGTNLAVTSNDILGNSRNIDGTIDMGAYERNKYCANTSTQTNVSCFGGSNGSATVFATGGAAPYTYSWSPTGGTGATASGLIAGTYNCLVTDASAQTTTATFTITQPSAINLSSNSQTNISCFGYSNGSAAINTPTGGAGGYTYNWIPGNPTGEGTTAVSGLIAGTWTCFVTDANSCTTTQNFTITQPTVLSAAISGTNTICSGDNTILTASPSGGIGPYTYQWNTSSTGNSINVSPTINTNYSLIVTDNNACTSNANITVTIAALASTTTNLAQSICNGQSVSLNYLGNNAPSGKSANTFKTGSAIDNRITVPAILGNDMITGTGFTVESWVRINQFATWSRVFDFGVGTLNNNILFATSQGNDNKPSFALYGGTTSSNVISSSTALTLNNWNHLAVTYNKADSSVKIYLNGVQTGAGKVNKVPILVNRPQSYIGASAWNDRSESSFDEFRVWNTVLSATTINANKGLQFTNAHPNAANLLARYTFENNVNDVSPSALNAGSSATAVTFGNIHIYTWSTGASTSAITVNPTSSTNYYAVAKRIGECIQDSVKQTITVNNLPTVVANVTSNAVCAGQSVTLNGSGASSYSWNNGVSNGVAITPTSTNTYTVTGTDANGCSNTATKTITVNANPTVNLGGNQSTCNPSLILDAGNVGSNYVWNTGATSQTLNITTSGNYKVTVTNPNGCSKSDSATITLNSALTANLTPNTNAVCLGSPVINLIGSPSGGTFTSNAPSGVFSPSTAGTFMVSYSVTNVCGTATANATINVNALPIVSATASINSICAGQSVTLNGTGAATYTWNNGAVNNVSFSPSTTTSYTIIGTDVNGCTNQDSTTIIVNALPTVTATASDDTICAGNSTIINASGTATTYAWSNGVISGIPFSPSNTNTYTVTGTDANGCSNTTTQTIVVNANPVVSLGGNQSTCSSSLVLDAGNPGSTYLWNNGTTSQTISVSSNGAYSVLVTNAASCTDNDTAVITLNSTLVANLTPNISSVCEGAPAISLIGNPAGGAFSSNAIGGLFNPTVAGTFTASYIISNVCGTDTASATIAVNANPVASLTAPFTTLCAGTPVTLTGLPSGGTYSVASGSASSLVGNVFNAANVGSYSIAYSTTNAANCTDTAQFTFNVNCVLGLANTIINNSSLTIMPNPSNGMFTINSNVEVDGTIELINELGQVVYKNRMNGLTQQLDVRNLSAGVYHLKVSNGNGIQTKRLSIVK
jgi:Concanavalin A-like lectin/glucanases superfamily/SprB repeat/Secretion system C-terminal sorting domain